MGFQRVRERTREQFAKSSWVLLALGASGCFFYDSRWGQQKQPQVHAAEHLTPQELHAGSSRAPVASRALRVRVYATPAHAAAVIDWQHQFGAVLECANGVFAPDFGVRFEAAEYRDFRPRADEEKLEGLLTEITEQDDGADIDWVIVLARSVPRFAVSADDLGRAPLLGKHVARAQ